MRVYTFMTKEEIYNQLKASRELHTANPGSKLWKEAFKLYQQERGEKLDMGCNKCFQKVLDWIQQ